MSGGCTSRFRGLGALVLTTVLLLTGCSGEKTSAPVSTPMSSPNSSVSGTGRPQSSISPTSSGSASEPLAEATTSTVSKKVDPVTRPSATRATIRAKESVKASAEAAQGVNVRLVGLQPVQITEGAPGDILGPGLSVTLEVSNRSSASVDVSAVEITLLDSGKQVASAMTGPPFSPFTGVVGAGSTAKGVYLFRIDSNVRKPVTVQVWLKPGTRPIEMVGDAPEGS